MEMGENIIKQEAKRLLPPSTNNEEFIITPTKLNPEKSEEGHQCTERIKGKNPDFLVVIAYGKIIPQAILDIPKIAPINIHGSLLPKYRGASPIQSTLLNNDTET
ncbi:MAG: formyltransferase family protein [bacterium]